MPLASSTTICCLPKGLKPFVSGKKSSCILPLISICIYCFFFAFDLWKTKVNTYSPFVSTSKSKLAEPEPWLINPIAFLLGTSGILIIFALPVNCASSGLKSSSNALFCFVISICSIAGQSPLILSWWQKSYLKNSHPQDASVLASSLSLPSDAGKSSQVSVPFDE